MSKLLLSLTIVREKTSGIVHASFGNYTFAALGMRLEELKLDDRTYFRFTAANARVILQFLLCTQLLCKQLSKAARMVA